MDKTITWTLIGAIGVVGLGLGFWLMKDGAYDGPQTMPVVPTSGAAADGQGVEVVMEPGEMVARVLADLRSGDRDTSERGLKGLAGLPAVCRGLLKARAEETLDPELKGLLQKRAVEMEEELAMNPPPVSLHVRDARMTDIVPLLEGQMHARMTANPYATESRYTLDAEGVPFWEVFRRLCQQHPVGLNWDGSNVGEMHFVDNDRTGRPENQATVTKGPWMFYARWSQHIPMPHEDVVPAEFRYSLLTCLALDPRLTVLKMQVSFDSMADEMGTILLDAAAVAKLDSRPFEPYTGEKVIGYVLKPVLPENVGKRISPWKVRAKGTIALSAEEFVTEDIENHLYEPHTVGPVTVMCTQFTSESQIFLNISATSAAAEVVPYYVFEVYDRTGRILVRRAHGEDMERQTFGTWNGAGGPYRFHLIVPRKVKEIEAEFEVKDFAIPEGKEPIARPGMV